MTSPPRESSELLETLYEGPLEDPPWSGFLAALQSAYGAVSANWILRSRGDPGLGLVLSRGLRRFENAYQERYFASDPFVQLGDGVVTALEDVVSREDLLVSEFYRALLAPAGILYVLGVDIESDALLARLRISRGAESEGFDAAERARLAELVPHLRRSLRLYARITQAQGERDAYAGAVDQLAVGTILLDERGRVLSRNERAARPDSGLAVRDGQLVAASPGETRRLRGAIERALAARRLAAPALVEALRLRGARAGSGLALLIRPLPPEPAARGRAGPALAIFAGDPAAEARVPSESLRALFGLTPAESALATRLASGLSLDEAAAALGIARNTARAHLRAVFEKTGVGRQAELVRLLLRSVASFG